ncbi:hypothetical protein C4572_03545 [Candidatus Parcubacteria bacterium]|nr:MAG: hypothetical protein C4572_03545 [Candidatus Parcubacteria bacterium]
MKKKILFIIIILAVILTSFYFFMGRPESEKETLLFEKDDISKNSPFGMLPFFSFKEPIGEKSPAPDQFDFGPTKDLGLKWGRAHYLIWPVVQPTKREVDQGVFDWSESDGILTAYPADVENIQNLVAFPARKNEMGEYVENFSFPNQEAEEAYKKFVQKAAERYDGDGNDDAPGLKSPVKYWQIDNEPDLKTNDWAGYSKLLNLSYEGIKSACPDCKVLIGGLGGETKGLMTFFTPAIEKSGGRYFDIFDYHCYGNKREWKKCGDLAGEIKRTFPDVEIWMSETGTWSGAPSYPPDPPPDSEQSEKDQSAALVKYHIYPFSQGVKKVFWAWGIIEGFGGPENNIFDNTGLIYDGLGPKDLGRGVKKLSYYTYRNLIKELEGADLDNVETLKEGGLYAYKFDRAYGEDKGRPVWILWNEESSGKNIVINELAGKDIRITESVPKYATGKEANKEDLFAGTGLRVSTDGRIDVPSGGVPIFVEISE